MHRQDPQRQSGQSIIIFTLLIVAMLAFAGLVIDGGNAYAMRRHAQNAADAGALAGARELAIRYDCDGAGSALDDAAIARRINEYVERNDTPDSNGVASDPTNTFVRRRYIDGHGNEINTAQDIGQVGYVPVNAMGVRVIPTMQVDTFFMGLMGFSQVNVAAEADARMGVVQNVNGGAVLPVTVHMSILEDDNATEGNTIRIWDKDPIITDSHGVPINSSAQRGWLNLSYVFSGDDPDGRTTDKNHSNNILKYWICNNYPNQIFAGTVGELDGDFINGDPGTRTAAVHEADCRLNQTVIIPIYDYVYSSEYLDDHGITQPEIGWVNPPNGNGAGAIYHIVGFLAVKITSLDNEYIETEFVKAVIGGNLDPGDPGNPEDLCSAKLKTVGLVR